MLSQYWLSTSGASATSPMLAIATLRPVAVGKMVVSAA